jgi:hypothetical protein
MFDPEQQKKVGAKLMRIRFEQRDPGSGAATSDDDLLLKIESARAALEADCTRYQISPSLWAFLHRFLLALAGRERK